ncbi:MAG: 6-bladed beta-propeller, partial [Candidatus Aminicenantaceae bacterium]
MKVLRLLFIFLIINSFLITLDSRAILQEVKTEVILYDDYFGHVPLPENTIELETKFSFNSLDLQHPVQMANDTSGNIYFTDETRNVVLKFDSSGEYLCQFGKRGKGKGEFLIPQ